MLRLRCSCGSAVGLIAESRDRVVIVRDPMQAHALEAFVTDHRPCLDGGGTIEIESQIATAPTKLAKQIAADMTHRTFRIVKQRKRK